ncbi:MAG: AraC family transcriptional regulator [Deltaproteobacteria bacterium]|nr:AraC family transcriptional regulator [Deltaproteobacteria bacterium]MBW2070698.1 AraC family transcriptional regulator [Deltaproteobacteria bacterium]
MICATNRASLLLVLWNILESYGVDADRLFSKAGLNPEVMKHPAGRYRIQEIDNLWRQAVEIIDDPCFGLKAAELWHPSNFGALGYAMLASHTLRTSLERMDRYYRFLSDKPFMKLDDTEEGLRFTLVSDRRNGDIPERSDAALAVTLSVCRVNYLEDLTPVSVTLRHSRPACSAKFFEYFRCPVLFGAPAYSLRFSTEVVDKILPGSNPQLAELHDQVMIQYLAQLDQDRIAEKVKAVIIDQLPSGRVTDETVSQALYMSSRKLQRQLQSAGTTFNTLLNEMRQELAQKYLSEQNTSITDIAFLLGFSESSAFSRAFRRWLGVTPSEFRRSTRIVNPQGQV